ncbi:MAG: xylulose kinase [Leptospiraceae bacterium]|nr:FGGY-family carbohydrate kinase [Leptospiraceae bacterium]MCP5501502.1 xylulose kinase [Leptospiraceae bacterium]
MKIPEYVLSVDLGTSGPKCALVDSRGNVLVDEFIEIDLQLLPGGGAEQDPEEWWTAIRDCIKKLLKRAEITKEQILAVSCSCQWSGTVAVSKEGKALMNSLIWLDSRGKKYIQKVTSGFPSIEGYAALKLYRWIRLTGGIPTASGKDPISHILYIKNELPEIYSATYKFLEPRDFINLCFSGKFCSSDEAITLYWLTDNRNIHNIKYSDTLISYTGIDKEKLPQLVKPGSILGKVKQDVALELGLSEETLIVSGAPDIHAAAIGSGAVNDFEAHLYVGTSSWLTCHVPFKKTDIFHNIASLPSAIPGRYLAMNEQETAGACLKFLKQNVLYHKDELLQQEEVPDIYKLFDKIVERTPQGSKGIIFTPWLYGERTPVEDHSVRAAFYNISLDTTREHMLRAVYEGVAYNSRWLLQYLEKFAGREMEYINFIGGGAASSIWCQIYADILGRKIRQVKQPILANIRGAAFIAFVALGKMSYEDVSKAIQIQAEYIPDKKNRELYNRMFHEFLQIYHSNKKIYRRINTH